MYRLTIQYRNGVLHNEECPSLEDVLQFIRDDLQTVKDHWNTTSVLIEWEPPATYCHDGVGHVYEHYDREDGNLYCECGARHYG